MLASSLGGSCTEGSVLKYLKDLRKGKLRGPMRVGNGGQRSSISRLVLAMVPAARLLLVGGQQLQEQLAAAQREVAAAAGAPPPPPPATQPPRAAAVEERAHRAELELEVEKARGLRVQKASDRELHRQLRTTGVNVLGSGYAMLQIIRMAARFVDCSEVEQAERDFKDKKYFRIGAS